MAILYWTVPVLGCERAAHPSCVHKAYTSKELVVLSAKYFPGEGLEEDKTSDFTFDYNLL